MRGGIPPPCCYYMKYTENISGVCKPGAASITWMRAICATAIIFVGSTVPFMAFAGNTNIVVDNQTGDESLEVEVSVGGVPCLISADTGFRYNMDAPAGEAQVDARVSGDIYGYYDLSYEPEADLTDGGIIRVTVAYSDQYGDEGEEEAPDLDGKAETEQWDPDTFDDGLPDTGMEEFDFSGGAPDVGTLIIQCQPVNAFDEAVLTVIDEDYKTYEIPLHMEPYFFRAKVKLPAGKYRESGQPRVTFNEYASPDSSLSYAWAHIGGAAFGGFFDIRAGEETDMTDLVIQTVKGGQAMVTDSRYYYNKKVYEDESRAEQKLDAEFKEKNYQSLVLDNEIKTQDDGQEEAGFLEKLLAETPGILAAAVVLFLLAAVWVFIHRAVKQYQDNNRMY